MKDALRAFCRMLRRNIEARAELRRLQAVEHSPREREVAERAVRHSAEWLDTTIDDLGSAITSAKE